MASIIKTEDVVDDRQRIPAVGVDCFALSFAPKNLEKSVASRNLIYPTSRFSSGQRER